MTIRGAALPFAALLVAGVTSMSAHAATPTPALAAPTSAGASASFVAVTHNADGTTGVTILDGGGQAHGQATLTAPGPATEHPPDPAVAAGAVWWADRGGAVWELQPDAVPVTVATLPDVNANTLVSLAVSPGGGEIAAAVVTLPAPGAPPEQPATTRLVVARNGVITTVHWPDVADWYDHGVLQLIGFDVRGPVGILDANPLQGGTAHGHPVQLDPGGTRAGTPLGTADCRLESLLPSGTTLCSSPGSLFVAAQTLGGDHLFRVPTPTDTAQVDELLSPEARRVAQDGRVWEGGHATSIPADFRPQGWLGLSTLVGVVPDPSHNGALHLATVALARAGTAVPLSVAGDYLGTLGSDLIATPAGESSGSPAPPGAPATAAPGGGPLMAWARISQAGSVIGALLLVLLAWRFRRRLDLLVDRGITAAAGAGPALRRRGARLYHRATDMPEETAAGTASVLRGGSHDARTIRPAGSTPPRANVSLFAASLAAGPASAVIHNPVSFDRFCVTWLATSQIGRSYIAVSTHDLPADTPWAHRLETATMRLRELPQFRPIAEELVGPWMNSELRDSTQVGSFSSRHLQQLFSQVVASTITARAD